MHTLILPKTALNGSLRSAELWEDEGVHTAVRQDLVVAGDFILDAFEEKVV